MAALYSGLWILLCIVLQVLVFNRLHLFGGIVLLYLIALIKMPFQVNRTLQIVIGFLCGLLIDIFSNTLGMHALVCTTLMWLRMPLLHMFILAEEVRTGTTSIEKLGFSIFIRYVLTLIAIHTILLYLIESFTLFNYDVLLIKILATFSLTFLFALAIEMAFKRN